MSRRQTLAALSPNQPSSKAAAVGAGQGRGPKDGGHPGVKGRKSVAPGMLLDRPSATGPTIDKRGSAFGTKPTGPKQDPRPLKDSKYQASCVQKIITYLSTHNYTANPPTEKALLSPTGALFKEVISFLLQRFDPTFRIQGKVEDEVPAFLKRLNYPFQISKSALFAVGSPHTWPAVLGALRWLVELLEYSEKYEACPSSFCDGDKAQEFYNYIGLSYDAFIKCNDSTCEELDRQHVSKYAAREAETAARIEQLRKAGAEAQAELEHLRSLRDPVVEAEERRRQAQEDLRKFEQLLEGLTSMKDNLIRKVADKKADVQAKHEQVAEAVAQAEQLRQRVAAQTINKADVNRMMMDRKKQKELLDTEKARCEEMEAKAHEQEVQIIHSLTALEAIAERYNKLANRLKLVPATSKRADGVNFELRINREGMSQTEFSNLDMKGGIKPALERLCAAYRQRATELGDDLVSLREAHAARQERNAESQEQSMALEAQIAHVEGHLQAIREAQEEKSRRLQAQAEAIKAEVEEHRNAASRRTEGMEERLARAQADFEQTKRDADAELSRLESDLNRALNMMKEYKVVTSSLVAHTLKTVNQAKEEAVNCPAARAFQKAAAKAAST